MLKLALPAVAALGLVAFAAQTMATDVNGVPQGTEEMSWHVNHEGDQTRLFYGVADTDHLAVMMTCRRGAGEIVSMGAIQPTAARGNSVAEADIDPLSGDLIEMRALSASDPAMLRLARAGHLNVNDGERRFDLAASPDERQSIRVFLDDCGTRRA